MKILCSIFDYFSNHVQVQDWIALIALNITVIGLTSLAEKRTVIGVDYGKYLIDEYKFLGCVRVFHLLVGVAIINAASLIVMLHCFPVIFELVVFLLLILSSWFVLVYLFSYVMRVHPGVKKEIYYKEILGLYVNANIECNFKGDQIVGMHGGDRTSKKISSNVQAYFNEYNKETSGAFVELFGPNSPVYARDKAALKYWKKLGYGKPHDYRVLDSAKSKKVNHISWEFFQMFRFSDIQDRWILEILNLYNRNYSNAYPCLRLYNVARVFGQLNRVGSSEGIWHYKFLDYVMPYVQHALTPESYEDGTGERRKEAEEYLHTQIALFIQRALYHNQTDTYTESAYKALNDLLNIEYFHGVIPISERLAIYSKNAEGDYKIIINKLKRQYNSAIKDIQCIIFDFGNVLVDWNINHLYGSYFKSKSRKQHFFEEVLSEDWIKKVDASKDLAPLVEERIKKFPTFRKPLQHFLTNWDKTISGEIPGMRELLQEIKKKLTVYGLSNWCESTFKIAREKYSILQEIEDYVISGGLLDKDNNPIQPKPNADIYAYFLDKYKLNPAKLLFIDDKLDNVETARSIGMKAIRFTNAYELESALENVLHYKESALKSK